jgi:endonuclease-3
LGTKENREHHSALGPHRGTAQSTHSRASKRIPKGAQSLITVSEVLATLGPQYSDFGFNRRYDPVSELVFTILSQHTSDLNSERAFQTLRSRFPSWEDVAKADLPLIETAIHTAGLAHQKAPRLREVLKRIIELRGELDLDFLKELPLEEAKAWLCDLNGVGPKTSAVVLCFALGMPAMPVDTHVHRVSKRLGLIGPKVSADQAHPILEALTPPDQVRTFHICLIKHGRSVCKALRPMCDECVLSTKCPSSQSIVVGGG